MSAAYGRQPKNPAWYLNLRADPRVAVQHGEQTRAMIAEVAEGDEGDERSRLWSRLIEAYPAYADYQRKTERQIPVVVLRQEY